MTDITVQNGELPPDPVLIGSYDDKGRGNIFAGAKREQSTTNPVIVFVPGYGGSARDFYSSNSMYGLNHMYARSYEDGFRTAFVSFNSSQDKPFDIWQNGKILAWQIAEICRYYKTEQVVVVAHSKGGIDSQTAAVYFDASPRIARLITLSSPHWGSQLADFAYSTFGWELAELLGQHNDGSFSMQTAYMQMYRKATDANPLNTVGINTFAGNGSSPAFSELWMGEQLLSLYGENDGVVTVKSAHNPKGEHMATLPFNHMQMAMGQSVWPYLKPAVLGGKSPMPPVVAHQELPHGVILRGGRMDNGVADEFPVDSTVRSIEIVIALCALPGGKGDFQIYSPNGSLYHHFDTIEGNGGTKTMRVVIDTPQVGNWHILCQGLSGAYVTRIKLNGTFTAAPGSSGADFSNFLRVFKTSADGYKETAEHVLRPRETHTPIQIGDGAYSLESVIRGVLSDGSAFERNILRPVIAGGYEALKKTGFLRELF